MSPNRFKACFPSTILTLEVMDMVSCSKVVFGVKGMVVSVPDFRLDDDEKRLGE
jgi:hypothetical protein